MGHEHPHRPAPPRLATAPLAALFSALLLGACVGSDAAPTPGATGTEAVFRPVVAASATPTPPPPLRLDEVGAVLREAVCWDADPALARACLPPGADTLTALQRIARSRDPRFIAPLVDMLWLDVGWERWVREALEAVSGQRFATPAEWYAWMTADPPPLPDGYAQWKGRLLAIIDPRFTELIHDAVGEGAGRGIGPEQLVWSLVGVNALPPLVTPREVRGGEQRYLASGDVVYGVVIGGEAHAYPERIVGWHGVVEDTVNGTPIIVAHCTPCGGAAVFDARASDGVRYTLGAAGLAVQSRLLFTDAETHSLWDAVSGRAVAGPLAARGVALRPVNAARTTWGVWSARYPETRVLSLDTGLVRDYAEGAALKADRDAPGPQFPVSNVDARLPAKTRVLGVRIGGVQRAYPLEAVERAGILHDRIGTRAVVLISPGAGLGVTVYDAEGVTIDRVEGDSADRDAVDSAGQRWFMNDERLLNARNSRVRAALPAQVGYWFAWSGAYPGTTLWKP